MGQPVLPAVEAMEILAAAVKQAQGHWPVRAISDARFDKFLPIDSEHPEIAAFVDVKEMDKGDRQAELATRTKAPNAAITRTKIHARLTFDAGPTASGYVPLDVAAAPEGICTTVDPDRIYRELVPFGPAYANIKAPLWLSPDGALAAIECPDLPATCASNHLGSPFALDAAFHAACVWGQHYHGVVAFPVAIDQRVVLEPTRPGTPYFARVVPQTTSPALLTFDLWLLDATGQVCETVRGLQMRDVSGGRLRPPNWIVRQAQPDPLAGFRSICRQLAVIELKALAPYAPAALSPLETPRLEKMAPRRKQSFLSARIALKRLSRRLRGDDHHIAPETITTICDDLIKPCCPTGDPLPGVYCSVSHDARFAIAVAADHPVGVDVEVVCSTPVKCAGIYMSDPEKALMRRSDLGQPQAAARIWSLKEAVAKATGMDLAAAWRRAQVSSIGEVESRFDLEDKGACIAMHATQGKHLLTLFCQK
jgi:phosphopantetheinyl transferase